MITSDEKWNQEAARARTVYIAGPMTGLPKHNFPAFDVAASRLRQSGWNVISPADIDRTQGVNEYTPPEETKALLRTMLKRDFSEILDNCGAMYMLKGWEQSVFGKVEHAIAVGLGMHIMYEETR